MKFGSYAIIDVVDHHFTKEPDWIWKIKPPTSGAELELAKFIHQNRVITGVDGIRREVPPVNLEIAHREVALTFGGTNIPDEEGKPILKDDANVFEVEAVLRAMPHEMVMEIWKAVGDASVTWGPAKDPNS
jgi:hypothetical protein